MIKAVQSHNRISVHSCMKRCPRLQTSVLWNWRQSTKGLFAVLLVWLLVITRAVAAEHVLKDISFSTLPGDQLQFVLSFDNAPPQVNTFSIDNPARVALDLPNTSNQLKERHKEIGVGVVRSVNIAAAQGRTRVVLNLSKLIGYQTAVEGNELILTLGNNAIKHRNTSSAGTSPPVISTLVKPTVSNIDFRRGVEGEGRILITLSDPNIPVDIRKQGGKIIVEIMNAELPPELERRLDVLDFATPVKAIDTVRQGKTIKVAIEPIGEYEHLAYQSDDLFTVEVREVSRIVLEQRKKELFTGEKLSLNFQNIETRSVLQLIADFTGLNLVVSDTVSGSLTLRLKNVPWDQALDIILKTKGLAMRKTGNVLLIAPTEEIAAREKLELEAQKQVQELAPLHAEFIQINYARANDIATLLKAPENSLLSERGAVSIDARTNTLLVQDTSEKLAEIRRIVRRLDVPVSQVLIESRIVIANDDFSKELGVRFGATAVKDDGDDVYAVTGSSTGTDGIVNDAQDNINSTGEPLPVDIPALGDRLITNLPAAGTAGRIAFAILGSDYLLDLELSALQAEGRGQIVSNPRVITSDQTTARIEQGVEIPYQEASSSGATSISFKKAVLSLEVTPHITPDSRISMDLNVTKDDVGQIFFGVPSIDTREIHTQVLVDNGQTVVLGGIFEESANYSKTLTPFFGELPLLGRLFRNDKNTLDRNELLIFVTPKMIDQLLNAGR